MEAPRLLDAFVRHLHAMGIELALQAGGWYRGAGHGAGAAWDVFCDVAAAPVDEQFSRDGVIYTVNAYENLVFSADPAPNAQLVFLRQLLCDYEGETLQGLRLHVELPADIDVAHDELWLDGGTRDHLNTWIRQVSSRPAFSQLRNAQGFEVGWADIG